MPLTEDEELLTKRECAIKLRRQGVPIAVIATTVERSVRTLRRWFDQEKLSSPPGRPVKVIDKRIEEAYELLQSNPKLSQEAVAANLDISISTLRRRLRKHFDNRYSDANLAAHSARQDE